MQYGMVKTPTLRNVAETASYFHNGAIWNLKDAIKCSLALKFLIKKQKASKLS